MSIDETTTATQAEVLSTCPTCDAPTSDSDKFCGSCGTPFDDAAIAAAPPVAAAPTSELARAYVPMGVGPPLGPGGPPPGVFPVAVTPPRGLKRTATLADLLAALLIAAVLFASIATVAVLLIDDPGRTGAAGIAGAQGPQGIKGDKGARGERGSSGKAGRAGANGVNGADGANGRACSNDPDVPLPFC